MNNDFGPYDIKLPLHELKRCPLCDAVTAIHHEDCFCCGWQGQFIHDPHKVAEGLGLLVEGCAVLREQYEPYTFPTITRLELWEMRVRAFFYRLKRRALGKPRRLDIRI